MLRSPTAAAALIAALLAAPQPSAAAADPLVYAVVVGNNDGLGMLPPLRYADDDALRFYRFATAITAKANVALLTELDVDTWRRIQLTGATPPPYLTPTRQKLIEVIELFKRQIARERARHPERPVHLLFFFSGHGEKGYFFLKKRAGPLAESAFTGADLQRTFSDSPASLNALFIDACKSQSLFVTKGTPADDELGPDFSGLIRELDQTVQRAPLGVITSTLSDKPAGEARNIRGGYFSHVLISGLRGAADADSDGVVRYGELAAFVSFHTRRIAGQQPWFRPPRGRLDAPLVVLRERRDVLEIPPGFGAHLLVFDGDGTSLVAELHRSPAQWTRLILSPGRYRAVWVTSSGRALAADVTMDGQRQRLMQSDFSTPVALGHGRVHKGDAEGAPAGDEQAPESALAAFDPASSGFDQPFSPRVVAALSVAYNSGLTSRTDPEAAAAAADAEAHVLSVGYGFVAPPVAPLSGGQGVSVAYQHRLARLPLQLGGRALFSFSDHTAATTGLPFDLHRLALQAEGGYVLRFGRASATLGAYVGWQLVLVTRQVLMREGDGERLGTSLSGDAAGFRAGLSGQLRVRLGGGLSAAVTAAWGLDLVHQDVRDGGEEATLFLRPQALAEVGYAF